MATPEELAARYAGRWVIGEDVATDGTRDWVAYPCGLGDERLTASTVDRLAERLEQAGR